MHNKINETNEEIKCLILQKREENFHNQHSFNSSSRLLLSSSLKMATLLFCVLLGVMSAEAYSGHMGALQRVIRNTARSHMKTFQRQVRATNRASWHRLSDVLQEDGRVFDKFIDLQNQNVLKVMSNISFMGRQIYNMSFALNRNITENNKYTRNPNICVMGMMYIPLLSHDLDYGIAEINGQNEKTFLCDAVTDGGGWILFMRRDQSNTFATMTMDQYINGTRGPGRRYWYGLEPGARLSQRKHFELRVDVRFDDLKYYTVYPDFKIKNASDGYALQLGMPSTVQGKSRAGDVLASARNQKFFTFGDDSSCVSSRHAYWWFDSQHCEKSSMTSSDIGSVWWDGEGEDRKHTLSFVKMMFRSKTKK